MTVLLAAALAVSSGGDARAEQIDFNRDVRPILSENCFACHGFDEATREAGLRLDLREEAIADLGGHAALVPGDAAASEAWKRISSSDPGDLMPPPDSHLSLDDAQKDILKRWIEQGAEYTDHWAFVAPVKPAVPGVEGHDDISPVDAFLLARLREEGLEPNPPADRATLIRRLSLDLTGLPPSAEEVTEYLADPRPDDEVYQELVERLLASPHFGERMALDWLDAARYADTNGFSIDGGRHMWLWRDWVIDAFNRNLPYDRFLVEQLAGDLLPDRSEAQLIASGFQRNNMVTHEGGTIPEENLMNYNADRVQTLGEAMLGLSLNCAQCHDHKYDPISQRDYYQLFAYFNTLGDQGLDGNAGRNPGPSVRAKTVLQTGEEDGLRQRIGELEAELAAPDMELVNAWLEEQRADLAGLGKGFNLHPVELLEVSTPNTGTGYGLAEAEVDGDSTTLVVFERAMNAAFDVVVQLPRDQPDLKITGLRYRFLPREPEPQPDAEADTGLDDPAEAAEKTDTAETPADVSIGFGHLRPPAEGEPAPPTTLAVNAVATSAGQVPSDQVDLHRLLPLRRATASNWLDRHRPEAVLDPRTDDAWVPDPGQGSPAHLTVTFDEVIDPATDPYLTTQLYFGFGRSLSPYRIQILAMSGHDSDSPLPDDIRQLVEAEWSELDGDQQAALEQYAAAHAPAFEPRRIELANLRERLDVLTNPHPVMVMAVADNPRDTFILHRGDYTQPTDQVLPGTPEFLPALASTNGRFDGIDASNADNPDQGNIAGVGESDESVEPEAAGEPGEPEQPEPAPQSRLALAEWVVMDGHPLTSRVAVNRLWQILFGTGIVDTPGDFGAQGGWPSHPELLDWLAVEFVERGWDVKDLVRMLVLTEAYRRDSAATPELLEHDFDNRLLARGPRFRLKAEHIRDHALRVSGLLVPRLGGPSVNPYTPGDLWREVSHYGSSPATAQTFVQDRGEKLYRRSLYTYWKRTVPPPNMAAFDAPNREVCTVTRPHTNTPLQALVLLNDVQFVEAARAFAQRILQRDLDDDRSRLEWAFMEALARPPADEELDLLVNALERERRRYREDPEAAAGFVRVGESPRDQDLDETEHAAWGQLASLLLNLSETITRN